MPIPVKKFSENNFIHPTAMMASEPDQYIQTFDQMYRETILKALARAKNGVEAAALLGMTVRTLERYKRKYGMVYDSGQHKYIFKGNKKIKHGKRIYA